MTDDDTPQHRVVMYVATEEGETIAEAQVLTLCLEGPRALIIDASEAMILYLQRIFGDRITDALYIPPLEDDSAGT